MTEYLNGVCQCVGPSMGPGGFWFTCAAAMALGFAISLVAHRTSKRMRLEEKKYNEQ